MDLPEPRPEPLVAVTVVTAQPFPYVMVMEALTPDGRRFHLGEGIGHVVDERTSDIHGTAICQEVLKRLVALREPTSQLLIVELVAPGKVEERLRTFLPKVRSGDLLMLLCADNKTIDACLPWLEIRASLEKAH
jgi:hypothetical protein